MRRRVGASVLFPVACVAMAGCASAPPTVSSQTAAPRESEPAEARQCPEQSARLAGPSAGETETPSQDADSAEMRVQTGDPLPEGAGEPPARGQVRWLASDPHVPFVRVDDDGAHPHGPNACTRWGVVGSRWHEVDAYGRTVGEVELARGEGYDATQCYELYFRRISGKEGVGLLASEAYEPADSTEWTPPAAARRALEKLVAEVDGLFPHEHGGSLPDLDDRALYYERPEDARMSDYPRHWAVAGGRALVVASYEQDGSWRIRHMQTRYSVEGFGPPVAYRPLAVVDLDGSGDPAIVFHETEGPGWADVLLEPRGMVYRRTAESVSGGTI